ncbi:MAG TPA: hypothetical protein VK789_10415 [Bryobacteraceae bacterium]|jgi:hypothetical protein|nr:hypothetical protein [Bryobacteraceae bacterium]
MREPENKPESSELEKQELTRDELEQVSAGSGPRPEPPDPC